MTSIEKVQSNRRNARFSSGPRSPGGRARAAQNARRHGFTGRAQGREQIEFYRAKVIGQGGPEAEPKPHSAEAALVRGLAEIEAQLQEIRSALASVEDLMDAALAACSAADRPERSGELQTDLEGLLSRARLLARYRVAAEGRRRKLLYAWINCRAVLPTSEEIT